MIERLKFWIVGWVATGVKFLSVNFLDTIPSLEQLDYIESLISISMDFIALISFSLATFFTIKRKFFKKNDKSTD